LKSANVKYLILALFYLVGRTGFVASPDVFNKTRPNRHINAFQEINSLVIKNVTSISAQKFKPKRLPVVVENYIAFQFCSSKQNIYILPFTSYVVYKGVYVDPPPLLG
jgi:hypothetical protein